MPAPLAGPFELTLTGKTYCGFCTGFGRVWCDTCYGFSGCDRCQQTYTLPCPVCMGGDAERINWS